MFVGLLFYFLFHFSFVKFHLVTFLRLLLQNPTSGGCVCLSLANCRSAQKVHNHFHFQMPPSKDALPMILCNDEQPWGRAFTPK